MNKKTIFIDTDTGNDDLMAICMLLSSKKFEVIGFSTVNGVSRAGTGAKNLARILSYLNLNTIPVIQGFTKPMSRSWKAEFPKIDRQRANRLTLVKNINIPKLNSKDVKVYNSIIKIFDIVNKNPKKVTLVCLGPLTNIATLVNKFGNKFTKNIEQIVLMGGAVNTPGIVPPLDLAEYNMYLDPEAAKILFDYGVTITMVPIDATKWVPADPKYIKGKSDKFKLGQFYKTIKQFKPTTKTGNIIKEIILNNKGDFNYFYDPLVSAILEQPNLIKGSQKLNIEVSVSGQRRGLTKRNVNKNGNVKVINKISNMGFYKLVLSKIV
jgi:inosine-uridine nucleoside N-ribohydrolase